MADYLIADDRAEWEHEQRTERDFETYARGKVNDFMADAGLTPQEHDVYWLRVGYDCSFREIGRMLGLTSGAGRESSTASARRLYRFGHERLVRLAIARDMRFSPLHPEHALVHMGVWVEGQLRAAVG